MAIEWKEEYALGIKEIDEQHKYFVGLVNELYRSIMFVDENNKIGDVVKKLDKYADLHFGTEEKYFDQFNYEGGEEHKKEHQKLREGIVTFKANLEAGKADIGEELLDFLENWLVDHLANYDQKYVECFKKNGLV